MADQLEGIVQRMIDAGESEANIASVIQEFSKTPPQPVAATEPDTYMGGFLKGAKEGMIGGATGFAKGLIPGAIEGVKGIATLPITLIKGVIDAGFGGARLYNDPVGTLTEAYNTYKNKPGELSETIKSALDLARNDPEAFGKEVGNLTGQVEVGIGASKLAPLAPRPVARAIGNIAEQVGTKGAWPIRMMGAHQLGSGNPLGMATIALPEVLRKGGTSMKQWGENDPLLIQGDIDKFKGVSEPSATSRISGETTIDKRPPVRIMSNAPDAMERNKDLFQPKVKGASTEVPAKELAQLKSQIPNNPELLDLMIRRRQAELAGTPIPELPTYKKPVRASDSPVRIVADAPKAETPVVSVPSDRVPIKDVKGSLSRRSPMSQVNPKLTLDEEKELFGNGPIYKITELPPDVLQKLLDRRAARSSTYRINEGLDKGARNASLRDSE